MFASWGTQAHTPTPFTSPIIYINRYTNCGDGVIEHTQMIYNFAPDGSDAIDTDQVSVFEVVVCFSGCIFYIM